jgi:membrane protease YdiL (CAAX protease family)
MTLTKSINIILTSLGVPVLFSGALMLGVLLSLPVNFIGENERFTYGILGSIAALLIIYVFLKTEGKSWKEYLLTTDNKTLVRFFIGSLGGLILASLMFLLQIWYSDLQITFTGANLSLFAWMALSLIPLAFMEELAFRSYAFIKLKDTFGVWSAQIMIAIVFALYHYIGGWSFYLSLIGPGVWSFVFGWLALRSNSISMPTGFHFGLNLALAVIGNKYWVPGLVTLELKGTPSAEMLQANEYFGGSMQVVILILAISMTYIYIKNAHGK